MQGEFLIHFACGFTIFPGNGSRQKWRVVFKEGKVKSVCRVHMIALQQWCH